MSWLDSFIKKAKEIGGGAAGWSIYQGAKAAAIRLNVGRPRTRLSAATRLRLRALYPTIDLSQVSIVQGSKLPADWFRPSVSGMTFGNTIYLESTAEIDSNDTLLLLIMHELVHVRQMSEMGEQKFAWEYGEQFAAYGGYDKVPLEIEAYQFVAQNGLPKLDLEIVSQPADGWHKTTVLAPSKEALTAIFETDLEVAANRWAIHCGFRGGVLNHEDDGTHLGVICLPAEVAECYGPTIDQLEALFPDNPEVSANRFACTELHYPGGLWNHENDGVHRGVLAIKPGAADMNAPTYGELESVFPGNPDVAAFRWATGHGYTAGCLNHEDDGSHKGILCFK